MQPIRAPRTQALSKPCGFAHDLAGLIPLIGLWGPDTALEEITTPGCVLSPNRTSGAFGVAEGDFTAGVRCAAVFGDGAQNVRLAFLCYGTTSKRC